MGEPLEILNYTDEGYKPLVFSAGWQVALLNWEPIFDLKNAGDIERHVHTDEVFVLWKGHSLLFISTDQGLQVQELQPGVIYNVQRGVWHNLLATRDASWIIVENRDTHLHDTEIRRMTVDEWQTLKINLPDWLSEEGDKF